MERELPNPTDQLIFILISETKELMHRDRQRTEMHERMVQAKKYKSAGKPLFWRAAHWLIDNPQDEERFEQLRLWVAEKAPRPEWLPEGAL